MSSYSNLIFLATYADYPGIHLFQKHYIYSLMLSPAHLLQLTGSAQHWKDCPWRTWLQQVEEDICMGLPISACQLSTLDRSLWRSLRPSAGQAQQWVGERV